MDGTSIKEGDTVGWFAYSYPEGKFLIKGIYGLPQIGHTGSTAYIVYTLISQTIKQEKFLFHKPFTNETLKRVDFTKYTNQLLFYVNVVLIEKNRYGANI